MSAAEGAAEYFDEQLNYTLGDEDTAVELAVLPERARHVVSIAGSGGRVLPLLARAPRKLTCVDISGPQLFLTELRLAALRALEHEEFVAFLGYPPRPMPPGERQRCFGRLALSAPARRTLERLFEAAGWAPIVYLGRFEQTLAQLSRVTRLLTGRAGQGVFETDGMEAQRAYLASTFPHRRFHLVLRLLGNAAVLNSLLYKGDFPRKNRPESAFSIYRGLFERLLTRAPARESWFLQLVFFGELRHAEGNPLECDPDVYARARRALEETELTYVKGDVLETIRGAGGVDFVSLSDVPTFFKGPLEERFLQELRPGLAPHAHVITRGHLRIPRPDTAGFEPRSASFQGALDAERTQLWQIQIHRAS